MDVYPGHGANRFFGNSRQDGGEVGLSISQPGGFLHTPCSCTGHRAPRPRITPRYISTYLPQFFSEFLQLFNNLFFNQWSNSIPNLTCATHIRNTPKPAYCVQLLEIGLFLPPPTPRLNGALPRSIAYQDYQRLSVTQERHLADWIRVQQALGVPPTHTQIRKMASRVCLERGDKDKLGIS